MSPEQPTDNNEFSQPDCTSSRTDPDSSSLPTNPRETIDSGIDIKNPGELQALAVALRATKVELKSGSQIMLTVDGRQTCLQQFDTAGDHFAALLDRVVPKRAEERERLGGANEPLELNHLLTDNNITKYFRSTSQYTSQMKFAEHKRCEFDFSGESYTGPPWTISLVEEDGSLHMTWTFDYSE